MNNSLTKKSDWGTSYGELVWNEFKKSRLSVACLIFIIFLFIVAVLAPFLANDKPYFIVIEGKTYFPLFRGLKATDYSVFLATFTAIVLLLLIRHNRRTLDPSVRGGVLIKQVGAAAGILLTGIIVIQVLVPHRLDAQDYKSMIASGRAEKAVFAPIPYGYARTDLQSREQPPSPEHWLGTDDVGSDVLCRLIHGSRISLSVGFVAVGISSIIGIIIGAILGYFGGRVDFIGMRIVEIMMAIPTFFLIITIVAFFPRSLFNIMFIIGITSWTGDARFIRAEFFKLRGQDFVLAARSLGLPLRSILFRHMLPNGITPVLVNATFGIAGAIFIEAALSFLGFGVAPPTPSWGQMLSLGVSTTGRFLWWLTLFPGLAIFFTVLSYNLVGEALRDAIDPRLRE
ncbi:MAG: ABC transporter permease [Deltaproteobacteria bacterium]|nr:ABC transporter permease [Deltaproteobacteria bacterium]